MANATVELRKSTRAERGLSLTSPTAAAGLTQEADPPELLLY